MRFIPILSLSVILMTGCASSPSERRPPREAPARENRVMLLDNSGGYSHAGRRIELLRDGMVIETEYTDIVGDEHTRHGTFELADGILNLKFGDRGNQRLIRVAIRGDVYWVYPEEVQKLRLPESSRLRQTSLKQKCEQTDAANRHPSGTSGMAPADSASRAGAMPEASGDS